MQRKCITWQDCVGSGNTNSNSEHNTGSNANLSASLNNSSLQAQLTFPSVTEHAFVRLLVYCQKHQTTQDNWGILGIKGQFVVQCNRRKIWVSFWHKDVGGLMAKTSVPHPKKVCVAFGVKDFTDRGEIQVSLVGLLTQCFGSHLYWCCSLQEPHTLPEVRASSSKCSLKFNFLSLASNSLFSPLPQNWTSTKWDFPGTIQELQIMGVTWKAPHLWFFVYLLHLSSQRRQCMFFGAGLCLLMSAPNPVK